MRKRRIKKRRRKRVSSKIRVGIEELGKGQNIKRNKGED